MPATYIRRFRMEFDLARSPLAGPVLPEDYTWLAWRPALAERHAAVNYASFRGEVDAHVFPCLSSLPGCRRLMLDIATDRSFLPAGTWLIAERRGEWREPLDCGSIQGMRRSNEFGSVQNVGVMPEHRGLGLGRALVLKALHGFRESGLRRAYLEVTAENVPAVELYRSLDFRIIRTMFRPLISHKHGARPGHVAVVLGDADVVPVAG